MVRENWYGNKPQVDSQLFPTFDGPLIKDGKRNVGGHSPRVVGAQFLAFMEREIPNIQPLARRASAVVLRYVAEAPLAPITDNIKDLTINKFVFDQVVTQSKLKERIGALEDCAKNFAGADAPQSLLRKSPNVQKFVFNMNSVKIHRFIGYDDADRQRTLCCWQFNPSEQSVMHECPSGVMWHDLCDLCAPVLRSKVVAQQGGDSGTSDSVITE